MRMKWLYWRIMLRLFGRMPFPLIAGAADDGGEGGDSGGGTGGGSGGGEGGEGKDGEGDEDDDEKELGEKGKKALQAERDARQKVERQLKATNRTLKEFETKLKETQQSNASEEEKKLAAAKEEAKREERERLAKRLKIAEVKAQVGGRANSELVARLVDVDDIDIDDDGTVSTEDVRKAIDKILEDNPELVKKASTKSGGDQQDGKGGAGKLDMDDLLRSAVRGG